MKKIVETKLSIITVSLVLLTFTVIIYDIHAFNPPRVLYVVVMYRVAEAPESWTTEDITNHPLKEQIMRYVNMSYLTGRRPFGEHSLSGHVYIVNDPKMEEFFGKYYVSSWCGTCNSAYLKDGDAYYYFMVGYSVVPYLDRRLAWSFSIAIVILWILKALSVLESKKESGKRMLPIGKLRGIIPRDVAIAVFNWAVFTVWIMLVSTGFIAYSPMIFDSVAIVVGLALSSYTTWLGIRAYRKWRGKDVEEKR